MTFVNLRPSTYEEVDIIPITSGWKLVGIQEGFESGKLLCPFDLGLFFYSAPAGMKLLHRDTERASGIPLQG